MSTPLPDYIAKAQPRPRLARTPWYLNTAPTYAGVFLWIGFYQSIATGTLDRAGLGLCLAALATAALLSFALYYYAPAMLGMKTGLPLYVVGSSTFGTRGGYLIPGLLMGVLQVGWFSVSTDLASSFILKGLGVADARAGWHFVVTVVLWGYAMAWFGAKGIRYVARVALFANIIPLVMIVVVALKTSPGFQHYTPPQCHPFEGFVMLLQIVTGFFATAGAAGADFGMENRNARDVRLGGLVGIVAAILFAGGITLLAMAGAHATHPKMEGFTFDALIGVVGGPLSRLIFVFYAIACLPGACFCAFIIGNSFATMLPNIPRTSSTMTGVTVSIVIAAAGFASQLVPFFQIIGASFGPVCGAMLADYLFSGRRWSGPRKGINAAGYAAWAAGFVVGILPFLPFSETTKTWFQPATLYSAITGFVVYVVLAKAGLQPGAVGAEAQWESVE